MEQISEGRGLEDEEEEDFFPFCILKKKKKIFFALRSFFCAQAASGVLCTNAMSHRKALKKSPPHSPPTFGMQEEGSLPLTPPFRGSRIAGY